MSDDDPVPDGEFVLEFDSMGTAEVVQGMLQSGGVFSSVYVIQSVAAVPTKVLLSVGAESAHRARWLLQESEFSDRELTFLATGEFDPEV